MTTHQYHVQLTHWNRRHEWATRLKLVWVALFHDTLHFTGDVEVSK